MQNISQIKMNEFPDMTDKIRNRIDLFICEEAILLFEKNKTFRTFTHWCDKLSHEITSMSNPNLTKGWVSKSTTDIQVDLILKLDEIFGFNSDDSYYLVRDFFINKAYLTFESVAIDSHKLFYKSIDKAFRQV